jgi:transcriptional regulator
MTSPFTQFVDADVRDIIRDYPMAWICAVGSHAEEATMLPLLGEYDDAGRLIHLVGHTPRRGVLAEALGRAGRVRILFQGPQSYISPEQAGLRNWAPTWNYVQLSIEAELVLLPDETGAAVASLVEAMERDRPDPWHASEMGERYAMLEKAIIGFRAQVTGLVGRFKLGQDERPEVREAIIASLGDTPLAHWMRRFAQPGG